MSCLSPAPAGSLRPRVVEPRNLEGRNACRRCALDRARREVLAREFRPVSRQLRHVRDALLRPAADAELHARLFDFSRRREPLPVGGDGRAGGRDDLRWNVVGRARAQDGDDGFAGRRRGGDARRLLFAELDDVCRASRADWPCAFRRSGRCDGLSGRGDGSFGDRARDGPLYRGQYGGRPGRALGDRRHRRSRRLARRARSRRAHFARLRRRVRLRAAEGAAGSAEDGRGRSCRLSPCISATRA